MRDQYAYNLQLRIADLEKELDREKKVHQQTWAKYRNLSERAVIGDHVRTAKKQDELLHLRQYMYASMTNLKKDISDLQHEVSQWEECDCEPDLDERITTVGEDLTYVERKLGKIEEDNKMRDQQSERLMASSAASLTRQETIQKVIDDIETKASNQAMEIKEIKVRETRRRGEVTKIGIICNENHAAWAQIKEQAKADRALVKEEMKGLRKLLERKLGDNRAQIESIKLLSSEDETLIADSCIQIEGLQKRMQKRADEVGDMTKKHDDYTRRLNDLEKDLDEHNDVRLSMIRQLKTMNRRARELDKEQLNQRNRHEVLVRDVIALTKEIGLIKADQGTPDKSDH